MVGTKYKSRGIILKYYGDDKWSATVEFIDSGFCDDLSTEGKLYTRYFVPIETAIDTIIIDAARLGIEFVDGDWGGRVLIAYHDGESEDWPMPDDWEEIFKSQADRIGWRVA